MHSDNELKKGFTLAQAAQELGISVPTARRLIFSKRLQGIKTMKGDKERWEVPRSEVIRLKRSGFDGSVGSVAKLDESSLHEKVNASENDSQLNASENHSVKNASEVIPVQAHLVALDLVRTLHDQLTEERRLREQSERTKMALEWQLHQYRSALTEQAESLAESQAMRRVAEARLEAVEIAKAPVIAEEAYLDRLKVGKPERKSWGQRLRGWLGMQKSVGEK